MSSSPNPEELENQINRLDTLTESLLFPLPDKLQIDSLKLILTELVKDMKKSFENNFNYNPWS